MTTEKDFVQVKCEGRMPIEAIEYALTREAVVSTLRDYNVTPDDIRKLIAAKQELDQLNFFLLSCSAIAILASECGIDDGLTWKDARERAMSCLEPSGEWPEGIERVAWGIFVPIEYAIETNRVDTPDDEFDYECSYELAQVHCSTSVITRIADHARSQQKPDSDDV